MSQVKAKVYYEVLTGNVLTITPECEGFMEGTNKIEDMIIYEQLKSHNIDEVDYIELEFGTLCNTFYNAKSYKVNLETKKLEITYFTEEELNTIQKEEQELNTRVSDISTYLSNSDEIIIADIENSILEIEKNKTVNGGM